MVGPEPAAAANRTHRAPASTQNRNRTLPTASGSSMMVSGCSLSSSCATSCSRRSLMLAYGLATNESKFGSPAPGTSTLLTPPAVPTLNTSSYGQNRNEEMPPSGIMCVR
eukprot:GHRQ01040264.1.p1 GENE.GHRQ01040264.1~~GHRQ01040264.1.p1  ORF type:complete len:110 (+),score=13.16 GHRQ01040264.1:89-418(+)